MTVAGSRPYAAFALLDEPLWRVLYVFHHIAKESTRTALRDRLYRVDAGKMTAFAFNSPDNLNDEMQKVLDAIAEVDGPRVTDADRLARGLALAERIDAGKVLSDDALVS